MTVHLLDQGGVAGGILVLDESADEKAGEASAGAGRQHNGRLGKIEQSQVGVYLAYAKDGLWTLWDGSLFLPEKWFSGSYAARRSKAEIPAECYFQTKIELGWELIARAQAQGLSFVAVAFDAFMGGVTGCVSNANKPKSNITPIFLPIMPSICKNSLSTIP